MDSNAFLDRVDALLVPAEYSSRISENVRDGWRLYRKGAYLFAAVPYIELPARDYTNTRVKGEIRKLIFALPFFAEKGLFLMYYGPAKLWMPHWEMHQVDKTALRPIILQAIHFVDPETGANQKKRTSWGPVKFGFCGGVFEKIELLCRELAQSPA